MKIFDDKRSNFRWKDHALVGNNKEAHLEAFSDYCEDYWEMLLTPLSPGADHPRPGGGDPVLSAETQGPRGGPGGRRGWPGEL